MENKTTDQELLPKPQTDLPLPEKDIPAYIESDSASQGDPLRSYRGKNLFKSKFFLLFVGISFFIAFLAGGFYLGQNQSKEDVSPSPSTTIQTPTPTPSEQTDRKIFCTQEAMECPDGSYVGRTGPNCEFEKCPGN